MRTITFIVVVPLCKTQSSSISSILLIDSSMHFARFHMVGLAHRTSRAASLKIWFVVKSATSIGL
jgi:hypothetical protein